MPQEIRKISNNEFKVLVENLILIYWVFCFNKRGHEKIEGEVYKNFENIWGIILTCSLNIYLLGLAKIFDKKSYGDKDNLSIYHFVKPSEFSEEDKVTIGKIKKARDEVIAHFDVVKIMKGDSRLESFGLDGEGKDIKSLFHNTFKLLDQIKGDFGYFKDLNISHQEGYIIEEFGKWLRIFEEAYGK